MDALYGKALLMEPPRILGVKLRPYSAYHAMVLMAMDNSLVSPDKAHTYGDLVQAVCICADRKEDSLKTLRRFCRSIIVRFIMGLRMFSKKQSMRAYFDFCRYVKEYQQGPDYFVGGDCKMSRIPWPLHMVGMVINGMPSITESSAWNMPINMLACYKAIIDESKGVDVQDREEIEKAQQKIADFEKRMAEREAANG